MLKTIVILPSALFSGTSCSIQDSHINSNPSNGEIKIMSPFVGEADIYSMEGRLIQTIPFNQGTSIFNLEQKGVYICVLKNTRNKVVQTEKIIIQ